MLPSLSKSLLWLAAAAVPLVSAERIIESKSLNPCMSNSSFSATLFNVAFTPGNRSLDFKIEGISNIAGKIEAEMELLVYGYSAMNEKIDPCNSKELEGMCPMNAGPLTIKSNFLDISQDVIDKLPGIAYTIPDLDAIIRIKIKDKTTHEQLACVEAELSNGHSVHQKAVAWTTGIIAGLGLIASAITSGLGHSNTAAHVAANAMSLFGYFQAQAFLGLCAVPLPPIVAAWTQNFQWTMGIIRVGFLQKMATWYQRATGGTPTKHLSQLSFVSVEVQKRKMLKRALDFTTGSVGRLMARSNAAATEAQAGGGRLVLHGIERVGFKARMETTNIFFTGYVFFVIFVLFTVIGVVAFKFICEGLAKAGRMKSDKFLDFRNGWQTVLKGILFRVVLIGFPQMTVLSFWELTRRDSAGLVVLAILSMLTMIGILAWASSKVVRIAQRSIAMHKNPAYILYSDPVALNKWGFLYVQFKAAAYWFIIPWLGYLLIKAMFVGLAQGSGKAQAISILIIELGLLVGVSVLRPWMDKKTNGFNIAIAAINFLSAFFLFMFTEIFKQPPIVTGVMGVIFFVVNAAFALVLLLMLLVSSGFALFTKNPDTRYQPMRDDRGSFIKSQTQLTTELDALGATARGEGKGSHQSRSRLDDDDDFSSAEEQRQIAAKEGGFSEHYQPVPPRSQGGDRSVSPSPPSFYDRRSPAPSYGAPDSTRNDVQYRQANSTSPWQRGAGYEQH
ncbi:TRP-domain-containing protein [Cucurbitaria berberidis CBS 394.84]|uniref:TRP-domain-containing protein n=1 Tax=Cucurbitaria berberidis CBS 394.84 TaxID=1168544 RepID=A0A9P4GP94_9PLEO|nr:TRP-domain-containing protein [Cucurbitaria berberidis CBS 394.84]KAF1848911.1 TRP-domain-containing protein [Cucurbitaria berberidis CBS 394.84]